LLAVRRPAGLYKLFNVKELSAIRQILSADFGKINVSRVMEWEKSDAISQVRLEMSSKGREVSLSVSLSVY